MHLVLENPANPEFFQSREIPSGPIPIPKKNSSTQPDPTFSRSRPSIRSRTIGIFAVFARERESADRILIGGHAPRCVISRTRVDWFKRFAYTGRVIRSRGEAKGGLQFPRAERRKRVLGGGEKKKWKKNWYNDDGNCFSDNSLYSRDKNWRWCIAMSPHTAVG